MLKRRFFISWGLSSVLMLILSFTWHGLLLNDLIHIPHPEWLFYMLALLAYLVIGFSLTFVYTYLSMGIGIRLKGSLMGLAMGFFIYLVAFVLGISFKGSGTEHLVVDFMWQMLEQGFGGTVIGIVYTLARRRDEVLASERQ
jgi:MFS family permease